MNVFWQHLQNMAKAQLFNGGYLAGPAIRLEAGPRKREQDCEQRAGRRVPADRCRAVLPHAQIATCR